ncbi:MAG: tRNA pseudouridine(13) synthase TruD [Planctomycetota bacterium]|nr:tRNA pseudouridine(13) synthase TruD [Planctomycetota bacterium]
MAIKHRPEEFLVEEILAPAMQSAIADRPARYAIYRLVKSGWTTPEAMAAVRRALGAPAPALACGGLKDRHARTLQHISLDTAALPSSPAPDHASGEGWSLVRIGFAPRPMSAEAVAGNRFRIVVRKLTSAACRRMEKTAVLLAAGNALEVVNYFGVQRFGSARHGRGFIAPLLVRGDFEGAMRLIFTALSRKDHRRLKAFKRAAAELWGKWDSLLALTPSHLKRAVARLADGQDFAAAFRGLPYIEQQMHIEAYQSYLWNETARRLVATLAPATAVRCHTPYGELIFPPSASLPAAWRELEIPLLSPHTALRDPWKIPAEQVLAAEEIGLKRLRIPGMRRPWFGDTPRRLLMLVEEFQMHPPEADELHAGRFRRTVEMRLPRGSYATVVLAALVGYTADKEK